MFSLLKLADLRRAGKTRFTGTAEGCLLFHVLLPHLKIQTALLTSPSRLALELPKTRTPMQTLIPLTVQSKSSVSLCGLFVLSHRLKCRAR